MSLRWADLLLPDWPAPANVRACVTTRAGGVSVAPFDSFNLGDHVEDDPVAVAENRRRLQALLGCRAAWLQQVHGAAVVEADPTTLAVADASWSSTPSVACAIMTADCLPVLFCDRAGRRVAAAHAGWRSLAGGVLEASAAALDCPAEQVLVWLGPAIGPQAFEVGAEVREAFVARHAEAAAAFVPSVNPGRFMADLYQLARIRLAAIGVMAVYGGGLCTFSDTERFYSYRRASRTGRLASLIWLEPAQP
ncbi:MAG TPA: peptidoglycan editing factor PgeF [Pseudomonas sp.]|nr:peptidoglycan editing factor PgeF [Pseudomonas sp.]